MLSGVGLVWDFFLKFKGLRWEMDEQKGVDVDGAHAPVSVGNEGSLPSTTELHLEQSHPGAGQVLPLPLAGFETEMQHLSPTPSHSDGAPQVGFAREGPTFLSHPARGSGTTRFWPVINERNGSFPWCPLDCQRCWLYLPCPPAPAPGCRAGLPAGKCRSRAVGEAAGMDLAGAASGSDPSLGSCAERLRGCSAGKKGRWVLQGVRSPERLLSPTSGMGSFQRQQALAWQG